MIEHHAPVKYLQSVGWVVGSLGRGPILCLFFHGVFNRARVILGISELPLNISSTRNYIFLQSGFNRAWILLVIDGLSLPIPFTRNHLFLFHGVFKKTRMMLGIVARPVTISSTMNHLLLQGTLKRAKIMLSIA